MPFSGGIYTVAVDFSTLAASPPIDIGQLDVQMQDIATALTNCILRDGTGLPTAPIDFGAQNILNVNTLTVTNALTDANTLILSKAGSKIVLARSADGSETLIIGSDSIGGSGFSFKQNGGTHAEIQLMGTSVINFLQADVIQGFFAATGALNLNAASAHAALVVAANNSIQSHGNLTTGLSFTSTVDFGIYAGADAPTIHAAKGSLYLCSNGSSSSTRLYVATDGAGTWVAVTTAS